MQKSLLWAILLFALLAGTGCSTENAATLPPKATTATTPVATATPTATPTAPPTPASPIGTPAPAGPVLYAGLQDGTLLALSPSDGAIYWRDSIGESAPSALDVVDGMLYVTSAGYQNLYALDAHTGVLRWDWQDSGGFAEATANGAVFVASSNGMLLALNASDGSVRWQQPLNTTISLAPVVGEGVVYLGDGAGLHAYNASNGNLLWQATIAGGIASNPLLSDGAIYALGMDGNFYSFNASDGSLRWKAVYGVVASAGPVLAANDSMIYLDTPDGASPIDTPGTLQALDASSGAVVWKKSSLEYGGLADSNGILYVDSVNALVALKDSSGAVDWTVNGVGSSNALIVNGLLYVGSNDGSVYALNAGDGSTRWHAPVGKPVEVVALGQ